MYKFLLSKLDQDVYDMFSYLLESNFRCGSVSELAKKLKHSRNRLLMILERVKEIQAVYPAFTLEFTATLEICIHCSSNFLLSKLYSVLLEETLPFKILDRLFRGKYVSLENTAQYYYLSNRTVQRKVRELDTILSNYGVGLDLKSKAFFKGKEYRIRYFFHLMYWQLFDGSKHDYFDLTQESVRKFKATLCRWPTHFRNIDQEKFIQIVAISVYRMKRQHEMTELPKEMRYIHHLYITYEQFKEAIMQPFFKENYLTKDIPENEFRFLYYMFSVITTYLPDEIAPAAMTQIKASAEAKKIARLFIQTVERTYDLQLTEKDQNYLFVNVLTIHSTSKVFSSKSKMDAFGKTTTEQDYIRVLADVYLNVKEMFPALVEQALAFAKLYEANNRLLFQYSMLLSLLTLKATPPIKVFHESKFGKIQDARQKRRLKQLFGQRILFVEDQPDLVITDYPADQQTFLKQNSQVKFFNWHSFQTAENWVSLIEFVEKFHQT